MSLRNSLVFSMSAIAIAACATPTSQETSAERARESIPDAPLAWASAQERVGDVRVGWISEFDDPVLLRLVEEAQANNKNLEAAAANVERSRALARQAGAALTPSVNLVAGATRSGTADTSANNSSELSAGLQVSWEADIWGRIQSQSQAALLGARSAEADYLYSQYSLAAAVAGAYFIAVEAHLQESIARQNVEALEEISRIVQVQFDSGLVSSQDLALANSDLATAVDSATAIAGSKRDALRAIETLLGRYPAADVEVADNLPMAPNPPGIGVPSTLLERRPDLIAAELSVAAAFNSLDSARAATLPSITLTSTIGGASNSLSDLLDPTNIAWTLAGNLVSPLIDGGLRQAAVDQASAEQKQAIAVYGQTALTAFAEVEQALDQGQVLQARQRATKEASVQAQEAFRVASLRHKAGETSLIDVLSIQRRTFEARSSELTIDRLLLQQRIDLNLALGGDWQSEDR